MAMSDNAITQDDVGAITHQVHALEAQLRSLRTNQSRSKRQRWRLRIVRTYCAFADQSRQIIDKALVWRPGGVLIAATVFGCLSLLVSTSIPGLLVGTLAGSVCIGALLYLPKDSVVVETAAKAGIESKQLDVQIGKRSEALKKFREKCEAAQHQLENAKKQLRQIQYKQSREYQLKQLLRRNWKAMRGIPFEDFLQEVFEQLGYAVETTKASGDQGVDLILIDGERRISIQVKGYVSSVSNASVQQAHAGMSFHNCHACAVITNSVFTASAAELAESVGCVLVGEDLLPRMVMGRFDLFDECFGSPISGD
jgi:hypothetical protein